MEGHALSWRPLGQPDLTSTRRGGDCGGHSAMYTAPNLCTDSSLQLLLLSISSFLSSLFEWVEHYHPNYKDKSYHLLTIFSVYHWTYSLFNPYSNSSN